MTPALRTLSEAEQFDWLRLIRTDGIGPRTFLGLLARFGSARAALEALPGLKSKPVTPADPRSIEAEMAAVRRLGARFVALCEPTYPPSLRAIDSAPPVLTVLGRLDVLQRPMVGIVGSRNASGGGLLMTERLARDIGAGGPAIVSGLARGVDIKAHLASLETGTVAVLAGGLERIYPSEHAGVLPRIAATGAVVAEMPIAWEPRGRDFPRRNRIVSGLSLAVVVVEAARRSGSLITARFAAEQGREVFAVPGHPFEPRAEGPNDLISQGATLCRNAEDVLNALGPMTSAVPPPGGVRAFESPAAGGLFWDELDLEGATPAKLSSAGEGDERDVDGEPEDGRHRLEALIGGAPVAVDDLVRLSGLPARSVQAILIELELSGAIERHGVNLVSRRNGEPG